MRSKNKAFANANKHFIFVINIRFTRALNRTSSSCQPLCSTSGTNHMTKRLLIIFFVLCSTIILGQKHNDILLCNSTAEKIDRLLLYDNDCFIWVRQDTLNDEEIIAGMFGQYKVIGDTTYFMHPDSSRLPNRYFCYCPDGYTKENRMHLYFEKGSSPPDDLTKIYRDVYNTKPPNLTRMTIFISFKAVRQGNKYIFYDYDNKVGHEYKICNN